MQLQLDNKQAAFLFRVLNDYKDQCENCDCDTCKSDVIEAKEIVATLQQKIDK